MVRKILLCFLLASLVFQALPQEKRREKVKRKYREEEAGRKELPQVYVHGRVWNLKREPLPGASVTVPGTWINVHTNENGEYFLKGLPTGRVSICVSYVGYRTKIIDYYLQEGNNDVLFTLDKDPATLDPLPVSAQLREQHLPDIPQSAGMISRSVLEVHTIDNLTKMAAFIPGLQLREEIPYRPEYVIRGIAGDRSGLAGPSRIAVYYGNTPLIHGADVSPVLFDMDRIEVLKGPQNTLFGAGAVAGAVRFLPRKPDADFNGFLTAGAGDFGMKEILGAINIPVVKKKLLFRGAGISTYRDGTVRNTFGGTLNGRNSLGGRISLRVVPLWNVQSDLSVSYQKDNAPGTAYMTGSLPNTNGTVGIFSYEASLDQGKSLYNNTDMLMASAEVKIFRNENNYLTSGTSLTTSHTDSRFDGDGTAAPAIDREENAFSKQFIQELRYNFSKRSRLNGSVGSGFRQMKTRQVARVGTNEQYLAYLFLNMPHMLVTPDGNTNPLTSIPQNPEHGELAGMPLSTGHEDETRGSWEDMIIDLFMDATWRLNRRICLTGGIRGFYEQVKMANESQVTSGEASTLGLLTGNNPGLFVKPAAPSEESGKWKGVTCRANLKFDLYENTTWTAGYARGRRPPVIWPGSDGKNRILRREIVNSFETVLKSSVKNRLWLDLTGYYYLFSGFQTYGWSEYNLRVTDRGKAGAFGAETSFNTVLLKNLRIFGNYSWIHARFTKRDSNGYSQEYAGYEMKLTPEHSFMAGLNGSLKLSPWLEIFATPSYTWKSHLWFNDANTAGLEQEAYGILNATAGLQFPRSGVTISFSGTNLLEEKYLVSAGGYGTSFGAPVFVPGSPRMISGRLTWRF